MGRFHTEGTTLAVLATVFLAGCGATVATGTGPAAAPTSAAPPTLTVKPTPGPVSTATLSADDLARQQRMFDAQMVKRDAFIRELAAKGVDAAALPTSEIMVGLAPQPRTLAEAVTKSGAIISGTVAALNFSPSRTTADFIIDRVIKGKNKVSAKQVVQVEIGIQLEPNGSFTGAYLGVTPGSPVLLPGHQAVLLMRQSASGEWNAGTGDRAFPVTNGTVRSDSTTPFHGEVDGLTLDAFLQKLSR
jgi:hypothetical protein